MRKAATFLLLVCAWLTSSAALADRRVALVIGNGAYQHVGKLPNPANDARAMAEMLTSIGYDVISGFDMSRDEMAQRISEFEDRLRGGASAAIIFYAGHGMQIDGKNYLIPVDADIHNFRDAKFKTIDADEMVDSASEAKVKIVLLDACRDNPFAEQMGKGDAKSRGIANTRGLAQMELGGGTMISFATSPGATAFDGADGHSPFTSALLTHLAESGLEIEDLMTKVRFDVQTATEQKQVPWANTSLSTPFFISPAVAPVPPTTAMAPTTALPASTDATVETAFWQSVQASGSREEIEAYLSKYPKGRGLYSDLAEIRLAALEKTSTSGGDRTAAPGPASPTNAVAPESQDSSAATETSLSLDRSKWRDLQSHLAGAGFPPGSRDGNVGDGTRHALVKWQTARGYKASGFLNKPQMDALMSERVAAAPLVRSAAVPARNGNNAGSRRETAAPAPGVGLFFQAVGAGVGIGLGCSLTHRC